MTQKYFMVAASLNTDFHFFINPLSGIILSRNPPLKTFTKVTFVALNTWSLALVQKRKI